MRKRIARCRCISTQASTTISINNTGSGVGSNLGHVVSFDAQVFAKECLRQVGRELGVP